MKTHASGRLIYSPSDLVRYLASPFASWMDRYYLEHPDLATPDEFTEDAALMAQTGERHEQAVLKEFHSSGAKVVEIPTRDAGVARTETLAAIRAGVPIIYQAALESGPFSGFADFLMLDESGRYQVWDTKLARTPRPYYAIQLCCYSDMLAAMAGGSMPEKFGLILGSTDRVEFRLEDFMYYYRHVQARFLDMQQGFTGNLSDRPEPLPRADHGCWTSHAERLFQETDHLVQVAGITVGQIKKLKRAGISRVADLAAASGRSVSKLDRTSLEKLAAQARLQCQTRADRTEKPDAPPRYELLPQTGANGEPVGLATLPPDDPADVFFDMEGYPLAPGGLEYLFGVCQRTDRPGEWQFRDWWAHDRDQEKLAFESFVDWVFARWKKHPGLHIYHYAAYEVSAVRRLSTQHDSRQDEVDELLRHEVFVDLYQIIRQGLRIGEDSYSIKSVERLYRPKRATTVATAADSIVQYARWIESGEPGDCDKSAILKGIRDYNEADCRSTAELLQWLRNVARKGKIEGAAAVAPSEPPQPRELPPEVIARLETAGRLRHGRDPVSMVLADVIDFHRREEKPMWWRLFDRAEATPDELRDDPACIEGLEAVGSPVPEKQSLTQTYRFDPSQECKRAVGDRVMFTHNLEAKLTLLSLDLSTGRLELKIGKKGLNEKFGGSFPRQGSLIPDEHISHTVIQEALADVAARHLSNSLHAPVAALGKRVPPATLLSKADANPTEAAVRVARSMSGDCLVIQGPPGTGKTYCASRVIQALLAAGKKVGVASNSHKAVMNLLNACGEAAQASGGQIRGIKVGGESDGQLFVDHPGLQHIPDSSGALAAYRGGVVGGTAWLFTRPEWEAALDFLFIDEAGQVTLANTIAMARCANNLVLLGDQMQLEQPVQGSHPGDAGLSALQYALKDVEASRPDVPVFHAVVPRTVGLFLGESRRMHPTVCRFISESMYGGRLGSHPDCGRQKIALPSDKPSLLVSRESGIVFIPVEHDGNIQQSDEEVARIAAIYDELRGRLYTAKDGCTRPLALEDVLFIAPYNAQVRALQAALPEGARVGSVDRFQGQEAPVCILSLCSSYGEYGSRGLAFILDRNRVNVAISRAQCLALVVADPRIAGSIPGSLEEMMLLNLLCKVVVEGNVVCDESGRARNLH